MKCSNDAPLLRSCRIVLALGAALVPAAAQAYVGPGAGLTAIGTMLALLAALLLAIVGFVWYPLKRLLARRRPEETPPAGAAAVRDPRE